MSTKEESGADIIDFAKAKRDADKARSEHVVSLDIFLNADNSEVWASVTNVDKQDVNADWHNFIGDLLRQVAWISDYMASNQKNGGHAPVASLYLLEDGRVSTRWNDELLVNMEQVDWLKERLMSGVGEIENTLTEVN